ncbi:MAG: carbonic anhydrase family protein [Candidatus Thiodiazotropha sp. (ex Dulcina madagascariensis)]|nr:carbonic anhydrase family protein [Candidatus Thiodiazotropha sp. (ex Dulcina madagascariensis)]
MKMKTICTVTLVVALASVTDVFSAGKAHWTYSGAEGPEHWGELDKSFKTCSSGKNQSPVNLTEMVEGELPKIAVEYKAGGNQIVNNGHTIKINYAPGSTIAVAGHSFELKQVHFHSPSENSIQGNAYPMEAHFVHADKDGNLAVIAVMYKRGDKNAELEKAWAQMPEHAGEKQALSKTVDAAALLPSDQDYYRFNGSLTTPPCSEGVTWLVMKHSDTASKEQLEKFAKVMHHPNNRPVQPINARVIIQ